MSAEEKEKAGAAMRNEVGIPRGFLAPTLLPGERAPSSGGPSITLWRSEQHLLAQANKRTETSLLLIFHLDECVAAQTTGAA